MFAMQEDSGSFARELAWEAIGVAGREQCNTKVTGGSERASIADSLPHGDRPDVCDGGFPTQYGLELVLHSGNGRYSVKQQPDPDEILCMGGKQDCGCGIKHMDRYTWNKSAESGDDFLKATELAEGKGLVAIGGGEVCRDAVEIQRQLDDTF